MESKRFFIQSTNRQRLSWRALCLLCLFLPMLLPVGWVATPASAQAQQTYWLGRLVGAEYVFDTRLPTDVADAIKAADPGAFVVDKSPQEFPPLTADGTEYSFVKARLSWDNTMFSRGQISLIGVDGTWGAKWFNRDKDSAEGKALAEQLTAQATAMSPGSAWHSADLLVLIAPNTATEIPSVRLSIFGQSKRYWLGRPDGTDYVFDTPLPPDFAAKIIAADANKWIIDKTPREFAPQNVGGTEYSFVKTQITYDKPQFDKGQVALVRKPGMNDMLWLDGHLNSTVGEPLARQLSAPKVGEWKSNDLVILISPNTETPSLRIPIPATTLAKIKMNELGQQTQTGLYYPTVKIPADLDAFRTQMLAYGNAGRRDPNFRKVNGAKLATDLSGDTVDAYADGTKTITHKEKLFKQSQTPPYFPDHVLNDALNQAAQFQAEYIASTNRLGHDGPRSYPDPKSGKDVNLFDLSQRADFFGVAGVVEAAGQGGLGDYPHSWMAGDTHFRPWFNVYGCYPEIGYGAAMAADGAWYFVAVPKIIEDASCLTATTPPTTLPTTPPAASQPAASEGTLVSLQSANFPDRFIRHRNSAGCIDPIAAEIDQKDSTFRLVSGLADGAHMSLESINLPNHFLVVEGSAVVLRERKPNDPQFDKDATFMKVPGLSDPAMLSLESFAQPGSYVRHSGFVLYVNASDGNALFNADATFKQMAPNWTPPAQPTTEATAKVIQATLILTHTNMVDSVDWSPDGSKIATGDRDGNLRVWDAATGASLLTMSGHDGRVVSVAWSPDGSKIAAVTDGFYNAAAPSHGTVLIWDAATGANLHTFTGHTARLDSVSWSPDGTKVVSASPIDESVRVWDAATGANLLTLTLPSSQNETSVAWSPDGTKLASTTNDKSILVWDSATGNTLLTLTGDTGTPSQLAWSPNGSKIAAGSFDRHMRVWDATTGDNLLTIKHNGVVSSVAWSPDGSKLASRVSEADVDSPVVTVWDATTGAALQTWPTVSSYADVLWSPDGSKITTATWDGKILIWDAVTGASLALLSDHGREVIAMAWSPDGSRLASGSADETVRVWAEAAPATSTPTDTPEPTATPATPSSVPNTPEPPVTPASTPTEPPTPTATPTPDPAAIAFEPPSLEFVWVKGSRSNPASQSVLARNVGGAGWGRDYWIDVPSRQYVPGGLQMNIAVRPESNWDVGAQEGQIVLNSNGMTITLPVKVTVISADGKLEVNRKRLNFGGFVGDPLANQVVGVTFTGLNSTNWTASGPSWLTLTPANGSVAATAPTNLTVGIDTAAISGAGKYTGTLTIGDGKTTHEIAVELYQVALGSPTIQLFGLEVTQGIQNLLNDIPFVAERPVFVRGHVRSLTGQPIEKVTAQLVGTRDGVDLGTLNPTNPGGSINIVADPNRQKLNESFLFQLPAAWRTGTVTLRLVGQSQPIACVDPAEKSAANSVANDCTVTLTYETIPALPIKYFLYSEQGSITYSNGGRQSSMTFTANADHAAATSQQLLAGLPIPRVDAQIHGTVLTFPGVRDGAAQSRMDRIMAAEHEKAGKPSIHFYGLFARYKPATDPNAQVSGGPGGVAVVPGFFGFGEYYTFQPMGTLNIHEIGHNLGRNHVGCAAPGLPYPASPDPAYPHPNQQISDVVSGDAAYYGFNIVDQTIYPPTYKDYMSYCHPSWISPYTYKAMMERLKIHYSPSAGNSGTGQVGASPGSPLLLVSGRITGTAAGAIDGVVDDTAGAAIPTPDASDYNVRLEDANGQEIATYPVTPQQAEGQTGEGQEHLELVSYTLAAPRPENLARVVLLYQGQPLAERVASASAPTLTLTTPAGGESLGSQPLAITWNASDADGDALTFNVDYSTDDGATWRKLAWGWSENTLEVASAQLPGSTQARIRVAANDGFQTTFAESAVFTVTDQPPVATILTAERNRYYVGGQTILLEGAGYDLEEGVLSDLTWYSDRDGVLGTGPTLALDADNLAEGTHLIRLEAKDSTGQSSFGDPTVGVASAEDALASNDTVRFDILYDPLTLPAELAVAPDLLFSTTPGATELLTASVTVSNLGDGDLSWTASSDSANVTLSINSGDTPATVVVTVDPSGLAEGLYEGTLTFTPTAALLEPVTVDYFITISPSVVAEETETTEPTPTAERFPLLPGQTIVREQKIPSESGNHYLIFQADGNMVVYTAEGKYFWGLQSLTDQYKQAQSVQMESDGNFVVRNADGKIIWSALEESLDPNIYLTLTAEGVLQLVSKDSNAVLWASNGGTPETVTAENPVFAVLPDEVVLRGAIVSITEGGANLEENVVESGRRFLFFTGKWQSDYPDYKISSGDETLGVSIDLGSLEGLQVAVLIPNLSETELGKAANAALLDAELTVTTVGDANQPVKPDDLMEVVLTDPTSSNPPYTVNFYRGEGEARQLVATFTIDQQ